jgi:hypothetical protein
MKFEAVIVDRGREMRSENDTQDARSGAGSSLVGHLGPLLSQNGVLHNLGFVVASISKSVEQFASTVAARWDGNVIHDPVQGARVAFFSPSDIRIGSSSWWDRLAIFRR